MMKSAIVAAASGRSDVEIATIVAQIDSQYAAALNPIRNSFGSNERIAQHLAARAKDAGFPIVYLTPVQIEEAWPYDWEHPSDAFQQDIARVFAGYYRAAEENQYRAFQNSEYATGFKVLSDEAFIARFGPPPWDVVNAAFEEAGLNYRVTKPQGVARDTFQPELVDDSIDSRIAFSDLSSGETILVAIALSVYAVTAKRPTALPRLLLLDEIDAPLHPSMLRTLLRVIDRVFVRELNIPVVLTTHSPSTVALCDEAALFRLEKRPRQLIKCTRDEAIQFLTDGYISVTSSTRFVLTEAKADRDLYTRLFAALVKAGNLPVVPNLVFVQATDKKDRQGGGCTQVNDWADKLPAAGLTHVRGLIDRDAGNPSSASVHTLTRYSIENFLLDPVITYAVLMHENKHRFISNIEVPHSNYYSLETTNDALLQHIADSVTAIVASRNSRLLTGYPGFFRVMYVNGRSIAAPVWLREVRGHDLVALYRESFRAVIDSSFVVTKNDMCGAREMLAERLPGFIPTELVDVFRALQTAGTSPPLATDASS